MTEKFTIMFTRNAVARLDSFVETKKQYYIQKYIDDGANNEDEIVNTYIDSLTDWSKDLHDFLVSSLEDGTAVEINDNDDKIQVEQVVLFNGNNTIFLSVEKLQSENIIIVHDIVVTEQKNNIAKLFE